MKVTRVNDASGSFHRLVEVSYFKFVFRVSVVVVSV
jgi:hypothetical protein